MQTHLFAIESACFDLIGRRVFQVSTAANQTDVKVYLLARNISTADRPVSRLIVYRQCRRTILQRRPSLLVIKSSIESSLIPISDVDFR